MEVEHHAGAAFVLGHDPRALERAEVVIFHVDLAPVEGAHQLTQLVLTLAGGLQGAVGHEGLEEMQLGAYQLCGQFHRHGLL